MLRTTILLPPDLKARAERRARARGKSLGELIREALEAVLADQRGVEDPLFGDDRPYRGKAPRDLAADHDRYLYGRRG